MKGSYIKLVKNPDYYEKGKPISTRSTGTSFRMPRPARFAFETGKVDILPGGRWRISTFPRLAKTKNACITDKGWEFFAPQSWLWFNHRGGLTADPRFRKAVSYAIDRNFALDVLWNGMGAVSDGPFAQSTSFRDDKAVVKYPYDPPRPRPCSGDGLQGRAGALHAHALWRYLAALGRGHQAESGRCRHQGRDGETPNVAGWNKKLGDWDFDISITFLYQYGDPALGVSRAYISSNIAKGSPINNVAAIPTPRWTSCLPRAPSASPTASARRPIPPSRRS